MAVEISSRLILYKCSEFIWPINTDSRYQKPINELGCSDYTANVPDNVTVTDLARKVVAIGTKSETVGVVESYSRKVIYSPTITEEIIVGDQATPATLLQISNASAAPVKQIVVDGKSTQVQTTQGKNLWNSDKQTLNYCTYSNGVYTSSDNDTNKILQIKTYQALLDKNYITGTLVYIHITNINTRYSMTFTIVDTAKYIRLANYGKVAECSIWIPITHPVGTQLTLSFRVIDATVGAWKIDQLQLEVGSTATTYEPFIPDSPSPDYPSPISSIGDNGSVTIRKIGKNLCQVDTINCATNSAGIIIFGKLPHGLYTLSADVFYGEDYNGTYPRFTLVVEYATGNLSAVTNYIYKTEEYYHKQVTITTDTTRDIKNIFCWILDYSKGPTIRNANAKNIQLELGSTATSYEPYQEQNITIPLSKPLLSVPTGAADKLYVDCVNKRCYIERNCEKYTFTGSENSWHQSLKDPSFRSISTPNYAYYYYNGICNICNYSLSSGNSGLYALVGINTRTGKYIGFLNSDTVWPTLNDLKTYLANLYNNGNPAYVIYQLATPYTEEIPWSDSYFLNTNTGINNIFCTDKVNANISVAYEADTIAKTIVKAPFKESTRIEPSLGFELCKHIQDMFSLFDTFRLYVAKTTREQIHISETYWDNIFFTLRVLESFIIADKASRAHSRRFSDSFVVSDGIVNKTGFVQNESVFASDSVLNNVNFVRLFGETVATAEHFGRKATFFCNKPDSLSISDNIYNRSEFIRSPNENISVSEYQYANTSKSLTDYFCTNEALLKLSAKPFSDSFVVSDLIINRFDVTKNESIQINDVVSKKSNSISCEKLLLIDSISRCGSKNTNELLGISDRITKKIVLNKSELLDIFDEFKRIFTSTRTFFESTTVTERAFKEMTSEQKECVVLAEFLSKSILALKTENLSLNDNFKRSVDFIRNVSEGFITGDDLRKTFGLNKRESIEVLDAFIRACNSIIADIAIDSEELDINKFLNIVKTPQGYTPFQEFNVGDYEYKEALIRFIIEVAEAQSEPLVRDVEHNVDIEEVIDRGVVSITDATAPTKIFFNKTYYTPPFVQVTLKGGSTVDSGVYPNILSTDQKIGVKRYFEIELINSRGERTIGVISWTSTGY